MLNVALALAAFRARTLYVGIAIIVNNNVDHRDCVRR